MKTQQDFLAVVRQSLQLPTTSERDPGEFPDLMLSAFSVSPAAESTDNLLDILQESCKRHNLTLHLVEDEEQAANLLVTLINEADPEFHPSKHVILHRHPLLTGLKLWKRLEDDPVSVHICMEGDDDCREKHEISSIGITVPECVVASHGTIIQQTGIGQPRSTSLLPSQHIAITREENIVSTLELGYQKVKEMGWDNVVFISGPSKTADIEAQLVFGAHGPRKMDLIIIR
ncbi:lactate utilization protein C [Desulfopila sp. IMCC35008]|uniref:LutC/YkgG family protein n=1 Tax=Desulfopila sp. IMCC35008 TaxID=2653858 RepID=UPI0013D0447D|nr:lactate utilization protein C [Desulfopila sp. IMCC35008]